MRGLGSRFWKVWRAAWRWRHRILRRFRKSAGNRRFILTLTTLTEWRIASTRLCKRPWTMSHGKDGMNTQRDFPGRKQPGQPLTVLLILFAMVSRKRWRQATLGHE